MWVSDSFHVERLCKIEEGIEFGCISDGYIYIYIYMQELEE